MATDLDRLVVQLSADIRQYQNAMNRAVGATNSSAKRIESRFGAMSRSVSSGFGRLGGSIAAAFGSAAAVRGAATLVDAATRIENGLRVTGLAGEDLAEVYEALRTSASANAAPLEGLVQLYSRVSLVQKELGISTKELVGFTDNVALALRVAGQSSAESAGALLQLSQALGSGVVRAEEFNSILEGAPTIARAVASGLKEAGGSVATLRQLVIDGKISSETFFRAFEVGAVVLRDQAATSVFTLEQRFQNLNTAMIDAAGRIDNVTGASQGLGGIIDYLTRGVGNAANDVEQWALFFELLERNSRDAGEAIKAIPVSPMDDLIDRATAATEATYALQGQIKEMSGAQAGLFPDDVQKRVEDIVYWFLYAGTSAGETTTALEALGGVQADFGVYIGQLSSLVSAMAIARAEAQHLNSEITAVQGPVSSRGAAGAAARRLFGKPEGQVSIEDAPATPSSGGGGGGGSSADQYNREVEAMERRLDALNRETELMRQLNPLVNDYGFAVERLNAQIELENAAKEAGLPLDEARMQQIEELASGYGLATAEAARLAEAQDMVRQTAEDLANASRQALDTIIDGFLEGKDAGEIFNSVLKDLGKSLINIGLNSMFGGGGGLGGLLGGLFGGKGFATGTANTGGMRGQPRGVVHGQEAVIPLPAGGNIPVDIRMPAAAAPSTGGEIKVMGEFQVVDGNLVPVITRISGQVSGQQVKAYDKQLPNRMQDIQMRQG